MNVAVWPPVLRSSCVLSHVDVAKVKRGQSFSRKLKGDSSTALILTCHIRSDRKSE